MNTAISGRRGDWADNPLAGRTGARMTVYAVLVVFGALTIVPFLWMISTSLKAEMQVYTWPPRWIPSPFQWGNYADLWQAMPFDSLYTNSLKIAVAGTLGQLLSCSLAAYAFARLRFKGRDAIFVVLLATMMIPGQVTMIPVFIIMRSLHLTNTHWALILPAFLGSPFGTFLLRQFFLTLPRDLEDAAYIDGSSPFTVYWRIMLPLAKPALAALAIFTFMSYWNDFLGPLIYLNSPELYTIPLGLSQLQGWNTNMPLLMAGSVLALIPVLVVYVFLQRYFVEGIAMTGLKG